MAAPGTFDRIVLYMTAIRSLGRDWGPVAFVGGAMLDKFRRSSFVVAAAALAWATPAAPSMRVNPMIVYLSPTQTSTVIQLTNVTANDLAIEINTVRRTVENGAEKPVPGDDDFVIFPPQMIIKARETQALRVQWVAGTALTSSQSYYVNVTQVPAPLQPGQSGVRIAYRFSVSVHIVPPGTEPDLKILEIKAATRESKPGFELTVRNDGKRFARLADYEMSLAGGRTWSREDMRALVKAGFLLPAQQSTFFVPYDQAVAASTLVKLERRGAL